LALIDFRNFLNTAKTAINTATPDGENTTLGSKADVAATSGDATPFSSIALLKGIFNKLANTLTVQVSGSKLAEQFTQTDAAANVITFTGDINAIEIYHEEATWQTFTVNGIILTIPAGGYRTPIAGTVAKTVTIPAGINCLVGRLV